MSADRKEAALLPGPFYGRIFKRGGGEKKGPNYSMFLCQEEKGVPPLASSTTTRKTGCQGIGEGGVFSQPREELGEGTPISRGSAST